MENNIFMELIYEKINIKGKNIFKRLFHKKKVKKFINDIKNSSPGFNMLWNIADFIKIAEFVYFYDNSLKNNTIALFSSKNYQNNTNGFKVNSEDCNITIKLFSELNTVILEIDRLKGDKQRTIMEFKDEQWTTVHTLFDEMLLNHSIEIINNKVIELFNYCYNKL